MRVLIVGINYRPEVISCAVYTTGLAEDLARQGARVEVVSALPYFPDWRVFDGWRGPFWRRARGPDGIRVVHCPLYVPRKPTGARRVLHHASFALSALPVALWKALRFRPDIVFAVAPGLLSAPTAWLAARAAGARTWLHVQDYEVEAAFATGLLSRGSAAGRLALAFERWVLRRFDRVSTISAPMLAKLPEKGVARARTYELRNWADIARVTPMPEGRSPLKAELGIETRFVALYSGALANKQGLEILPAIARALAHRGDVTVVVCGEGPLRDALMESAEGVANMRFLPLQPIERLSDLLGMADVHLLPQIAGAADLVLPSKLTNMLASGRPVVATAEAGTTLGREVEGAGLLAAPGDGAAAARAVERLLDDPALRGSLGEEARRRALERWDKTAILARFHAELERLADAPHKMADTHVSKKENA